MKKRILCFGDSNTYGYDPRSYLGGRYPEDSRWPSILSAMPEWDTLNLGENGREIPCRPPALSYALEIFSRCMPWDAAVIMLGGNDLLQHSSFTAEDVTCRMETFLRSLLIHLGQDFSGKLVLVSPPPMAPGAWVQEARLLTQSARLGACYSDLARRLSLGFVDAAPWQVPLTFDGVHFSPEGHAAFARMLSRSLLPLLL